MTIELVLIIWVLCAILCAVIASANGRNPGLAALVGFLLGLIGVVIYAVIGREPERVYYEPRRRSGRLPRGWTSHIDPQTGDKFYVDMHGNSTWDRPISRRGR